MKPFVEIRGIKPVVRAKEVEIKPAENNYYDEKADYDEPLSYNGVFMYLPYQPVVKIKTIKPYDC